MALEINDTLKRLIADHLQMICDLLIKGRYDGLEEYFELDSQFLEGFFRINYEGSRFQPLRLSEVLEIWRVGEYSAASYVTLTTERGKSLYLENRFALSADGGIYSVDNEFFVAERVHAAKQIVLSIADSLYNDSLEMPDAYAHDRDVTSINIKNAMVYYQSCGYEIRQPTYDDLDKCKFTRLKWSPEPMLCDFDLPMKDAEKDDLTLSLTFSNCDSEIRLDEIDLHVL